MFLWEDLDKNPHAAESTPTCYGVGLTASVQQVEDFQPHAYGLMPASAAEGGPPALAALSLAEDWLTSRSHPGLDATPSPSRDPGHSVPVSGVCNGGASQANGSANGAAGAGAKPGVDVRAEHAAGFLARVRFRRALLRVRPAPPHGIRVSCRAICRQ